MGTLGLIYQISRADFFERVRRVGFLIVLAATVGAGYLFVPPVDAGYRVLQLGEYRGIYNSAWIGLMFGLIAALHLPLAGFFLVKNTVERDRGTGVGEIIATSLVSKITYILGKWLSNLVILILILSVATLMAGVMQILRAEDTRVQVLTLVTPIWLMGLPVLAIAAAMSVLFETVSFLRGSLGNVIFFFLWLFSLAIVLSSAINEETGLAQVRNDLYGYTRQLVDIQQKVLTIDATADVGSSLINAGRDVEHTFVWEGSLWKSRVVLQRLVWGGISFILVWVAAIVFDRFDPAPVRVQRVSRPGFLILAIAVALTLLIPDLPSLERICWAGIALISLLIAFLPDRYLGIFRRLIGKKENGVLSHPSIRKKTQGKKNVHQVQLPNQKGECVNIEWNIKGEDFTEIPTIIQDRGQSESFASHKAYPSIRIFPYTPFGAEISLMLKGQHWFWWLGILGLNIACLFSPVVITERFLIPAIWCFPIFLWSQLGVRENRHNTSQMIFSSPHPVRRLLSSTWLAGFVLTLSLGMGGWIGFLLMGDVTRLLAWFLGCLFVPALALATGVWTHHERFFEVVYLFLWYMGLFEQVPSFDFVGITNEGITRGMPWIYFVLTLLLFGIAIAGRVRQVNH
jgi:hypothetical protein